MPAFYVDQRQRTLLGGVRLVPRRRRLLGDSTEDFFAGAEASPILPGATPGILAAPDLGTPTFAPIPAEPSSGPSLPVSFFAPSKPVIPAPVAQPAIVAPSITKTFPSIPGVQIVFPSQGSITMRPVVTSSWLDQQMIAGVPNSYLAIGAAGLAAFAMLRSGKRRR